MLVAAAVAIPAGLSGAIPAFTHPVWLAWGIGVGVCSSVIPYVTDQLVMARLPRATFALMLALLPAAATVIGLIILGQVPTLRDLLGIGLIIAGVALHHSPVRPDLPPTSAVSGRRCQLRSGGDSRQDSGTPARKPQQPQRSWAEGGKDEKRNRHAIRAPGPVGAQGIADRPGHDELRRPFLPVVGTGRG
jgi:hypothetical protein